MYKFFACLSLVMVGALATPVKDALMFEGIGDTATVESTVREARAAPSHIGDLLKPGVKDAFLFVYGDTEKDDGDLHGYSKKTNDKGKDGYRHFDSFHKKDGDKYGYEKHSEYGQENKAGIETENEKGIKLAHLEAEGGKKDEDDKAETRQSYAVIEDLDEDNKKQAKKKAESDYSFFGEGDGGDYESADGGDEDGETEASENDEDDGKDVETEEDVEEDEEEDEEY